MTEKDILPGGGKKLYHGPKRDRWKAEKPTQSPMSVLNKLLIYCYYPKSKAILTNEEQHIQFIISCFLR